MCLQNLKEPKGARVEQASWRTEGMRAERWRGGEGRGGEQVMAQVYRASGLSLGLSTYSESRSLQRIPVGEWHGQIYIL